MNSGLMYDEVLAHRIGLIPLKTDLEKYNLKEKCTCSGEGCPSCQVSLRLNVEGPKTVYSGDLISDDPDTIPAFDNIPIVKLKEGQQLMLEATARLGFGTEHSKYQAVCGCGYKIIPEITIEDSCNNCGKCVEECPRDVFSSNNGTIEVTDIYSCSLCYLCVKVCEENAIQIDENTNRFLFSFEVDGSMTPLKVIKVALNQLKERFAEFTEKMEKLSVE
jgi:DNA-directed RNA polymerase subunit D